MGLLEKIFGDLNEKEVKKIIYEDYVIDIDITNKTADTFTTAKVSSGVIVIDSLNFFFKSEI